MKDPDPHRANADLHHWYLCIYPSIRVTTRDGSTDEEEEGSTAEYICKLPGCGTKVTGLRYRVTVIIESFRRYRKTLPIIIILVWTIYFLIDVENLGSTSSR